MVFPAAKPFDNTTVRVTMYTAKLDIANQSYTIVLTKSIGMDNREEIGGMNDDQSDVG
jgi:hypothetical protein